MKRWIHAATCDTIDKVRKARESLRNYSPEQVNYVKDCQKEISNVISNDYIYNFDGDNSEVGIGSTISDIKTDYLLGAIDSGLMTEREFEDIFALLDVTGIELAIPFS